MFLFVFTMYTSIKPTCRTYEGFSATEGCEYYIWIPEANPNILEYRRFLNIDGPMISGKATIDIYKLINIPNISNHEIDGEQDFLEYFVIIGTYVANNESEPLAYKLILNLDGTIKKFIPNID